MEQYTEADLVSFGNYLLSNERKKSFEENPSPEHSLEERLAVVHDADVANWKHQNPQPPSELDKYQPHERRVVEERIELIEKITKLHAFFKTPIFSRLPQEDQYLLNEQSQIMMNYADVLLNRINRF